MIPEIRKQKMFKIIQEKRSVSIKDLVKVFQMSRMTILRDINDLEGRGLVKKVYDGVVTNYGTTIQLDYHEREKKFQIEKKRIVSKAIEFISDGSCIGLSSGSTAMELAKILIRKNYTKLTVITNGLNIANILVSNPNIEIIIPGGYVIHESFECGGHWAAELLKQFIMDIFFFGFDGMSFKYSVTLVNPIEAEVARVMLKQAKVKCAIADSSKIGITKVAKVCDIKDINILITDDNISKENLKILRKQTRVYVV